MARVCLALCCLLLAVALVESEKVLTVNGKRCVIGAEMMNLPADEMPDSCPSFVDEDGGCFFGDMGLSKQQCIDFLENGEAEYNSLPRAVYIEE